MPLARHKQAAESIIKMHGLNFALAVVGAKDGDLREARNALSSAIADALAAEHDRASREVMSGDAL